jgi:nucleoside-diphosphate-sugar epimerase
MKNRALIIGASGIAGSNLADRLIEARKTAYSPRRGVRVLHGAFIGRTRSSDSRLATR